MNAKSISKQQRSRLNSICPYYTMYPLEFPFFHLRLAKRGDRVLDPFCGRGTTNFAARLRGLRSVGIDSNPVAVAVAAAKFQEVNAERVIALCERILKRGGSVRLPSGAFWRLCFHRKTLGDICRLRNALLRDCSTGDRIVLRALLLGALHGPILKTTVSYLSNQMPRTYATKPESAVRFWRKRRMRPKQVDVLGVLRRRLAAHTETPAAVSGRVLEADSRDLGGFKLGGKFGWIITSPPYLGMRTYNSDQWLRNWFLGGPERPDYGNLRQLGQGSREKFVADLAKVWKGAARHAAPGARLIVRFGSLPSRDIGTAEILKKSIRDAGAGWKITAIVPAGNASDGHRQVHQFGVRTKRVVEEIDLHALFLPQPNVRPGKARTAQGRDSRTHGGRRRAS